MEKDDTVTEQRGLTPGGKWGELLCLALIVTFASHAVPFWVAAYVLPQRAQVWVIRHNLWPWVYDGMALLFGLILAFPAARRSGICLGRISLHWGKVLLVMALPVALTAMVYPRLAERPFAGTPATMWAISPLAQDLVFAGYLYGRFEELSGRWIHPKVPINGAILITAFFFALWHVPNFIGIGPVYVCFQLCYVFVGAVWVGMTRLWTGSVLYITLAHMGANFVAWCAN